MLGLRLAVSALLVTLWAFSSAALGAATSEKGPRCSDGIDNDGDTLVDGDDPDCGGGGTATIPTVVLTDDTGAVVAVPYQWSSFGEEVWVFPEGYEQPAKAYLHRDLNNDFSFVGTEIVYFSNSGCLGIPYVAPVTRVRYITLHGTRDYGYYVYDPNATTVSTTVRSRYQGRDNTCDNVLLSGSWTIPIEVQIPHTPPVRYERR